MTKEEEKVVVKACNEVYNIAQSQIEEIVEFIKKKGFSNVRYYAPDIKLNKDGFSLVMSLYFSEDYPLPERK